MVLNNEVSILNIANIDNDIKDASTRSMIADEEKMEYATHNYEQNQYFIWNDRKLYKTLTAISVGTALVVDGNVKYVGTIASQLYDLYHQSDDSVREAISNVEETNNASRAYYAGEYILWIDGFLYRVTVNLSLGTLWKVGTNIERVDNVTKLINSLEGEDYKIKSLTALTEKTNKASRTYYAGEQFIFNSILVEATTTINQNATITIGGNCKAIDPIAEQLKNCLERIDAIENRLGNKMKHYTTGQYQHIFTRDGGNMFKLIICNFESTILISVATAHVTYVLSDAGYTVSYLSGENENSRLVVDGASTDINNGGIRIKVRAADMTSFICEAMVISGSGYLSDY